MSRRARSKRRFSTSAPPDVVFFTDRDLGNIFPDALAAAGIRVERHRTHFDDDEKDEEWLRVVGERGWVAITHNKRIRYTPNEIASVMRNGVALLVVVGHARHPELARNFVATVPAIRAFLARNRPPFIAKVYRPSPSELEKNREASGSVSLWHPKGRAPLG